MILDDDHSGVFSFSEGQYEISESVGEYHLEVSRYSGARGKVILPYKTTEGTAKDGNDFVQTSGHIVFEDNQTSLVLIYCCYYYCRSIIIILLIRLIFSPKNNHHHHDHHS